MTGNHDPSICALIWHGDHLALLDQRLLPGREVWLTYSDAHGVATAIRDMVVRGAPAIGICAAYGLALESRRVADSKNWRAQLSRACEELAEARPTAVNLFWALERMMERLDAASDAREASAVLDREARSIHEEDLAANHRMAEHAVEAMGDGSFNILTHCNTGSLATGGYGTALGVIRHLWHQGRLKHVYADETRPWLQGARLTTWELYQEGIPVTLNADGAAAQVMRDKAIDWVIVGADRITQNGDVANKIGTYALAILAKHHGARFMVVAPSSTIDRTLNSGTDIPIEERDGGELRNIGDTAIAPDGVHVYNPVFDVTPASLVDVIVTEQGATWLQTPSSP